MEIRQLRYFVTVAQTLNFSEAARRLYITQGTLSQQIQQLEYEMGSPLFDRSTRTVTLTEAGEQLLPLATETLSAAEACKTRMADLRSGLVGNLSIGLIKTFKGMMTDAARPFIKEHSGVSMNIQFAIAEDLLEMLRSREIDIALAYKSVIDQPDIESETLFKTSLHILMRKDHPLAGAGSLTLDGLSGFGVIIPGRGLQARRSFDKFLGIDTRKLNIRLETNDADAAMDMIQGSDMLAVGTPLPAADRDGIIAVPLENGRYQMQCCAHRLKDGYRKKSAEIFLEKLRESARFERFARGLDE